MAKEFYDTEYPRRELQKLRVKFNTLHDKYVVLILEYNNTKSQLDSMRKNKRELKLKYEEEIAKKDAIIKELKNQLAHEKALNDRDGYNTSLPTSQTPIGKKKIIPNSREKSNKPKGGQPGHTKKTLEPFKHDEINEIVNHELNENQLICAKCGEELINTGKVIDKDEYDVDIKVIKRRHKYHIYQCVSCGTEVRVPIENRLKEKNQYSPNLQAMALSLMASNNVAINKVQTFISGLTNQQVNMSQGFICKLYTKATNHLFEFKDDLIRIMIEKPVVYWDDTVIYVNTERACMRFYGDDQVSLYFAHDKKDLISLQEDNILPLLTSNTQVMHDHNLVNYNDLFSFENIECVQHLQRDLQKVASDNVDHTWALKLKELISDMIKKRKMLIENNGKCFTECQINDFNIKLDKLLAKGYIESKNTNKYATIKETTLLDRISAYRSNYFKWITDFNVPTTNNLSERGLRCIKSHLKISGQFENINSAQKYALVKTYIETCRKSSINEFDALVRLCEGNPYKVSELFN